VKAEVQRLPRFAVLIDADNTSPQIAGGLFEEVAGGRAVAGANLS
jgi:hypothetical protein